MYQSQPPSGGFFHGITEDASDSGFDNAPHIAQR